MAEPRPRVPEEVKEGRGEEKDEVNKLLFHPH